MSTDAADDESGVAATERTGTVEPNHNRFNNGNGTSSTVTPDVRTLPIPTSADRARYMVASASTALQSNTEDECCPFFVDLSTLPRRQVDHLREVGLLTPVHKDDDDDDDENDGRRSRAVCLLREKHARYCVRALLRPLSPSYTCLDASRPWMIYWTLHSLDLLDALPEDEVLERVVEQLGRCRDGRDGGHGGGPGQLAHCATTYAAVCALVLVAGTGGRAATTARRRLLDARPGLAAFLRSNRVDRGDGATGFRMHRDGEDDVRGAYTALAVASLLRLDAPDLVEGVAAYARRCRTYEGGFAGEPGGAEAHGGYTYCAVATLRLLGEAESEDDERRLRAWLARRQTTYEGGFSGRCNKLVDGCYSFWIGGAAALSSSAAMVDGLALQRYVLLCGQSVDGGLRDKPSKPRDFYHTCYSLSGLSLAQHGYRDDREIDDRPSKPPEVYGHPEINLVRRTDPLYNITVERVKSFERFLDEQGVPRQKRNRNKSSGPTSSDRS